MQARPEKPRLAWAVTGSGHYLEECLEIVRERDDVDLFYSRAGEEVVRMYGYDPKSIVPAGRIYRDRAAQCTACRTVLPWRLPYAGGRACDIEYRRQDGAGLV